MKHHRLGGSTTSRWFKCAYSIPATEAAIQESLIPAERETNYAADKGTATHTVGEKGLETGCDAVDYIGTKIAVESGNHFIVDDHMASAAQVHIDYCRDQIKWLKKQGNGKIIVFCEFNSELGKYFDREDIGGPCDYVIVGNGWLIIVDYKNGVFPVEVELNKQFLLYALGCYYRFRNECEIKNIKLAVTQPNYDHKDGPCREYELTRRELLQWKREALAPAVDRVQRATKIIAAGKIPTGELGPRYSDEGCFWCPIQGMCSEYKKHNKVLQVATTSKRGQVKFPKLSSLTLAEAEEILSHESQYISFLKSLKNYLKQAIANGTKSSKYKLVESNGNRTYKNDDLATAIKIKRKLRRCRDTVLMQPEILKSPAQLEQSLVTAKLLSAGDAKELINSLCVRPSRGPIMVDINDGRAAIVNTVENDFKDIVNTNKHRRIKPAKKPKH